MSKYEKAKIFLMGAIVALLLVYAVSENSVRAGQGRYQLSSVPSSSTFFVALVMDTETGQVKLISEDRNNEISIDATGNPFQWNFY